MLRNIKSDGIEDKESHKNKHEVSWEDEDLQPEVEERELH